MAGNYYTVIKKQKEKKNLEEAHFFLPTMPFDELLRHTFLRTNNPILIITTLQH